MLKNKIKVLLVIMLVFVMAFTPFVNADLEEDLEYSEDNSVLAENNDEEINENDNFVDEENDEEDNNDILDSSEENKEIIKGDQYLVGESITVNDSIDGNVFIIANEVTINSQIIGNVFVCANTVKLAEEGNIENSFFVAANEIKIDGIAYDIYTASNNLTIMGYVYRDIHVATEEFNLYGSIGRDAFVSAKKISFQKMEEEYVDETGIIYGNLTYSAENEIEIPEDVVEGNIKYEKSLEFNYKPNYVFMAVSWLALVLLVWFVLKKLSPKFIEDSSNCIKEKALKTFGRGFLGLIIIPIISVLLMVMVVTAKAGVLLLLAFILAAILSETIFIIAVNNILAEKFNMDTTSKKFFLLICTSLVAWGLAIIPFVGGIFALIYVIMGFGIIVNNLKAKKQ